MYTTGFLVALIGLGLYIFYSEKEASPLLQLLFMLGMGMYAYAMLTADAQVEYKFATAFRDLLVLGSASLLFTLTRNRKNVYATAFTLVMAGWYLVYSQVQANTFPQKVETVSDQISNSNIPLAENGELLIEVANGHSMVELKAITDKYNLTFERAFFPERGQSTDLDDYFLVNVPDGQLSQLKEIEDALMNSKLVDWVEGNEVIQLDPMSADFSSLPKQVRDKSSGNDRKSMMNDPAINEIWGFEKMNVEKLYERLTASGIKPQKRALIAILDTGVDAEHEDLKDNFHSLDNRYNNDPIGHGTHCAGIAAAVSNNGIGIASFAPDNQFVKVTSIKVLNPAGAGTQGKIIKGMTEAADAGADVISLSLGGLSTKFRQRAYVKAVEYANESGAIVVVAAGNSNRNAKSYSPANTPGVIAVSAVDTMVRKSHFSNTVQDLKMGVAAPGVKVYSTIPGSKYKFFNGTSMAAPYVSGLVGVMKSIYPKLDTKQAYEILHKTGTETDQTTHTGKFIQPAAAIEMLLD